MFCAFIRSRYQVSVYRTIGPLVRSRYQVSAYMTIGPLVVLSPLKDLSAE